MQKIQEKVCGRPSTDALLPPMQGVRGLGGRAAADGSCQPPPAQVPPSATQEPCPKMLVPMGLSRPEDASGAKLGHYPPVQKRDLPCKGAPRGQAGAATGLRA